MGRMRLMVPFFCLLLITSMVPLSVVSAKITPQLIGGNPLVPTPPPNWPEFWAKFNKVSDWDLEYYNGVGWVSIKSDLRVVREYPEPNKVKLTLIFDASHAANYRLTFAINSIVREYVTKLDQYRYELNYGDYSMIWDWSDAVSIPSIVFTHGLQEGMFWFRMGRDGVPLGAHVEIDPTLIASYAETNQDSFFALQDEHPSDVDGQYSAAGQSFQTTTSMRLKNAVFYMMKTGLPTGTMTAQLYAHSGVYGTSSKPTGAALATSDAFDCSTLGGAYALVNFTFSGANQYVMAASTSYCIAVVNSGNAVSLVNYPRVGADTSAPGAPGNAFFYNDGAWENPGGATDTIFYVYGSPHPPVNDACASSPTFTKDANGWVNVTVSDAGLVADLATVTMLVNSPLHNFTLRWTQATNTFSEVSDPDSICTLDTGASTRVNVDADTDEIQFVFMFTNGVDGDCNVTVTSLDDGALSDIDTYVAEFSFTYWSGFGALLNSLFEYFGILDYMTQITTYINGLTTYFSTSLVNIVTLVVQQFQFITMAFNSVAYWFGLVLGTLTDFVQFVRDIMDGVSGYFAWMGNLWDWIGWSVWAPVLPLYIFLRWLMSIPERAKVTSGGEIQVFINDFNTVASLISYFVGVFSFVVSTVYQYVTSLLDVFT